MVAAFTLDTTGHADPQIADMRKALRARVRDFDLLLPPPPPSPPEFIEAVLDAVSPSRLASRLEATAAELIDVACVQSH